MTSLSRQLCDALGVGVDLRLDRVPEGVDHRTFARQGHAAISSRSYALPDIAVLESADPDVLAVGVDIEPLGRPVDPRVARFVVAAGDDEVDLLTLWTIKEAAYKAAPLSRDLTDFVVADGCCRTPDGDLLPVATTTHGRLRISVAAATHRSHR